MKFENLDSNLDPNLDPVDNLFDKEIYKKYNKSIKVE